MKAISDLDAATEQAARSFLAKAVRRYALNGAVLFGSRARRTHRPDSDADVAVILHGHRESFLHTKLALADIAYDVLLETGVLVQPLPVWEDEWEHPENHTNPALLQKIDQEGVRL